MHVVCEVLTDWVEREDHPGVVGNMMGVAHEYPGKVGSKWVDATGQPRVPTDPNIVVAMGLIDETTYYDILNDAGYDILCAQFFTSREHAEEAFHAQRIKDSVLDHDKKLKMRKRLRDLGLPTNDAEKLVMRQEKEGQLSEAIKQHARAAPHNPGGARRRFVTPQAKRERLEQIPQRGELRPGKQ